MFFVWIQDKILHFSHEFLHRFWLLPPAVPIPPSTAPGIFLPRSFPAAQMPLRFVVFQYEFYLFVPIFVQFRKSFREILVNRWLAHAKPIGRLPHSSARGYQIIAYFNDALFYVFLHKLPPTPFCTGVLYAVYDCFRKQIPDFDRKFYFPGIAKEQKNTLRQAMPESRIT